MTLGDKFNFTHSETMGFPIWELRRYMSRALKIMAEERKHQDKMSALKARDSNKNVTRKHI